MEKNISDCSLVSSIKEEKELLKLSKEEAFGILADKNDPRIDRCLDTYPFSISNLLSWYNQRGKKALARRVIKRHYYEYDYETRRNIWKSFITSTNKNDRVFVYKRLRLCWDNNIKTSLVESIVKYHDYDACVLLISHSSPSSIQQYWKQLQCDTNNSLYYEACKMLGKHNDAIQLGRLTPMQYLEVAVLSNIAVPKSEVESILNNIICYALFIRVKEKAYYGTPSIDNHYENYNEDTPVLSRCLRNIAQLGYYDIVNDIYKLNDLIHDNNQNNEEKWRSFIASVLRSKAWEGVHYRYLTKGDYTGKETDRFEATVLCDDKRKNGIVQFLPLNKYCEYLPYLQKCAVDSFAIHKTLEDITKTPLDLLIL